MLTPFAQAIEYIKAGDIEKGKHILIEILKHNPRDENAWLWLTRCVTETEQKRYCFEKILKINPQNQHALEGLSQLNNPISLKLEPKAQTIQPQLAKKNNFVTSLLTLSSVIVGIGLVLLFLYAWLFFPP
jgi:thioredoxin-like negative regulator of GroEL